MKPSSISTISGSKKGSKEIGLFFGSICDGTNPTTYTSSALHLSTFDIVAIVISIAPQPRSDELNGCHPSQCAEKKEKVCLLSKRHG